MKKLTLFATLTVGLACSGTALAQRPEGSSLGCLLATCGPITGTQVPGWNNQLLQGSAIQTMLLTSNAVRARFAGGLAPRVVAAGSRRSVMAGGLGPALSVWGNYADVRQEDTRSGQAVDSSVGTAVVGFDLALQPNLVVGLSGSSDSGDGTYATGGVSFDTRGYSFAPYLGWQINSDWLLDATLGWGAGKVDNRNSFGSGHVESDRLFAGINLTYSIWYGNWQLSAKGSHLYAEEKYGTSTFSFMPTTAGFSNKINQTRLGAQVAYAFAAAMPYVGVTYVEEDPSLSPAAGRNWDKTAVVTTAGVNFFSADNRYYGGIAYSEEARDHTNNRTLAVNAGLRF